MTFQLPLRELLQYRRPCVGDFENFHGDLFEQPALSQSVQLALAPFILRPVSYLAYQFLLFLDDRLTQIVDRRQRRQSTVMGSWYLPFVATAARARGASQPP